MNEEGFESSSHEAAEIAGPFPTNPHQLTVEFFTL
jgi:hypothetical protein